MPEPIDYARDSEEVWKRLHPCEDWPMKIMKRTIGCLSSIVIVVLMVILFGAPVLNWLVERPVTRTFHYPDRALDYTLKNVWRISQSEMSKPLWLVNWKEAYWSIGCHSYWYEIDTDTDEFSKLVIERLGSSQSPELVRLRWDQIDDSRKKARPKWWPKPPENLELICIDQYPRMNAFYVSRERNRVYLFTSELD